jgi:hypothetical protein
MEDATNLINKLQKLQTAKKPVFFLARNSLNKPKVLYILSLTLILYLFLYILLYMFQHVLTQYADFRKLTDEEKLKNFGGLFKLYQEEIDKLTQRSKFAETSFLNVYKLFAEAPDPVVALAAFLVSAVRGV